MDRAEIKDIAVYTEYTRENTLREITSNLSIWKESGPEVPKHSKEARKSAEEAMKLLRTSANLLHHCEETYGFKYRQAKLSLKSLYDILDYMRINKEAPEFIAERIGYSDYQDFAQDAFINQLNLWADELEKGFEETCTHSPDFRSVTWYGQQYTFNQSQAIAVKLLWEAHKDPNKVGVNERDIAQAVDSYAKKFRLQDLFYSHGKYHPAWRTMIIFSGHGFYCLQKPERQS